MSPTLKEEISAQILQPQLLSQGEGLAVFLSSFLFLCYFSLFLPSPFSSFFLTLSPDQSVFLFLCLSISVLSFHLPAAPAPQPYASVPFLVQGCDGKQLSLWNYILGAHNTQSLFENRFAWRQVSPKRLQPSGSGGHSLQLR